MEKYIKHLLKQIHDREMREFAKSHITHIDFDKEKMEAIVLVDKQYAIHKLLGSDSMRVFSDAVRKCFGWDTSIQIHLEPPHHTHEREMLIPHNIHY